MARSFDALLEDVRPDRRTAADVFTGAIAMQVGNWKSSWILAASALFGVAVIAGLFIVTPDFYRSMSLLKLGGQGSTEYTTDVINSMVANMESPAALTELITADGLYQRERSTRTLADLMEEMKKNIHIQRAEKIAALVIGFDYKDPQLAQKVTQDLATRLMNESEHAQGVSLQVLDPASLPKSSIRGDRNIVAFGVACFLLMWGGLTVVRRMAARGYA
jgi:uncharacterized protein involved in exopolysaccharide biosynthesis